MVSSPLGFLGSPSRTRWLFPSRYPGICVRCRQAVPAGIGEFRREGGTWLVRHPGGHCHTPGYVWYVSESSEPWRRVRHARLEYAGGQCEWSAILAGRCSATKDLEIHHRHYRTFGAEALHDVIALCHAHHALADDRRRAWGSWPVLGHPFWHRSGPISSPAELAVVAATMARLDAGVPPGPAAASWSVHPAQRGSDGLCPRCGRATPEHARFCGHCGAPVTERGPRAHE